MNIYFVVMGILSRDSMSGSDKALIELSNEWKNCNINILTPKVGSELFSKYHLNAKYHLAEGSAGNPVMSYLSRIAKFRSFKIPDNSIIYSSSNLLVDIYPSYKLKLANPKSKWVVAFHMAAPNPFKGHTKSFTGGFKMPNLRNTINYLAERLFVLRHLKKADFIFAINKDIKKFLIESGIPEKKIKIVGNGVNLEEIKKVKSKNKRYDGCFIGRFHPQKGILDLVKIWKIVTGKKPSAKLVIIGSGELESELRKEIERNHLQKNITLAGHLDGREKFSLVKSSKLLLFPSTYESWGIVAAEAMACGLPVVAYDLPVYKDIFKKGMVRVKISDTKSFAQQVLNLLGSPPLYKRLSREALAQAAVYSWKNVAKEEMEAINEIN